MAQIISNGNFGFGGAESSGSNKLLCTRLT